MTEFKDLNEQQKNKLAALPYRVGLWISYADETGGLEADQQEKQALHGIITGFTQDFLKSEFVEQLMLHTMAQNVKWSEWEEDLDKTPTECREAIDMLADKLEQKDITSMKITLMEIGRNVAMAFRETDYHETLLGKIKLYFMMTYDSVLSVATHQQSKTMLELTNISRDESKALEVLAKALRPDDEEGLPNSYEGYDAENDIDDFEPEDDTGAAIEAAADTKTETEAETEPKPKTDRQNINMN